ncbi:MAG: winged helix-turn-helix transcriptional regulator [Oscillospiraceae bacterium]|nr:winged helix-turn-helix transcriptional regulator [Oscillospiraceae bacterium]
MGFGATFKALSNPVRREILTLLKNGQLSAGEIATRFDLTGATISHHLGVLKQAELVFETRDKNYIYYQLNTSVLEDVLCWIADLKGDATHET